MELKEFIKILEQRFNDNMQRHKDVAWKDVEKAILSGDKADILIKMEETGGEVDVVKAENGKFYFFDCVKNMPKSRTSLCYDQDAWEARKENKPISSAEKMTQEIGAELLNEEDYLFLQSLGEFDIKSQVWLKTSDEFRKKGEALFANKRHGRTFVYYNGAQSYYSSRGFRCKVIIK